MAHLLTINSERKYVVIDERSAKPVHGCVVYMDLLHVIVSTEHNTQRRVYAVREWFCDYQCRATRME